MLFTSYKYALFVALAFCVYYFAARLARGRRLQNLVLLVLSYSYYALWDASWCLLLAAITATESSAACCSSATRAAASSSSLPPGSSTSAR